MEGDNVIVKCRGSGRRKDTTDKTVKRDSEVSGGPSISKPNTKHDFMSLIDPCSRSHPVVVILTTKQITEEY
jgi:hypothetical protein